MKILITHKLANGQVKQFHDLQAYHDYLVTTTAHESVGNCILGQEQRVKNSYWKGWTHATIVAVGIQLLLTIIKALA